MRVNVIGRHLEVTDAIRRYAESKVERLLRFFNGTQQISVLCQQAKHGEFEVEIVVDVVKHENFVAHGKADDLYACIDQAVDKSQRQLKDFKEKLRMSKR